MSAGFKDMFVGSCAGYCWEVCPSYNNHLFKSQKIGEEERGEEIRGMELMLIIETGHFIFGNSSSQNLGLVINKNRRIKMTPQRDS